MKFQQCYIVLSEISLGLLLVTIRTLFIWTTIKSTVFEVCLNMTNEKVMETLCKWFIYQFHLACSWLLFFTRIAISRPCFVKIKDMLLQNGNSLTFAWFSSSFVRLHPHTTNKLKNHWIKRSRVINWLDLYYRLQHKSVYPITGSSPRQHWPICYCNHDKLGVEKTGDALMQISKYSWSILLQGLVRVYLLFTDILSCPHTLVCFFFLSRWLVCFKFLE